MAIVIGSLLGVTHPEFNVMDGSQLQGIVAHRGLLLIPVSRDNWTMGTIDIFMRRIIDYAGLFPPASLTLDAALREFHQYQHHPRSDFLGRFVMPFDRLNKLTGEFGEPAK